MSAAKPVSYTVCLSPDLEALAFSGEVTIEILLHNPGKPIVLDSVGLDIQSCVVTSGGKEVENSYEVTDNSIAVTCPAAEAGTITATLRFSGELQDNLIGFYDAPYNHNGKEKHLAVTQFEDEEARRAFPCFDHPSYNTPFSIILKAPDGTSAVSNAPVDTIEKTDGGSLYRFKTTPPMPTYLLFFGVGDFEYIEDPGFKIPLRVAAVPGKAKYGKKAMEAAKSAIRYCEEFTGIEYPIGKLDLIGVPAFAYGAMENLGAITFRENLLFYVPGATSEKGFERNALITAHEVAHMWFGDLVSPAAWRFIWLNEAFATYLQYLIGEVFFPERRIGDRFLLEGFFSACTRDSLIDTVPIELPEDCHMEVDASTAPIFYQKAGLLLRMVHRWLGKEKFKAGVRSYLTEFAYSSTDTEGFLASFGKGAGSEVSEMIENWIRQPGFPILRAERRGNKLVLRQERFTWLDYSGDEVWHIPVSVKLFNEAGEGETLTLLLREKEAVLELPGEIFAYKINEGHTGIFHTAYEAENVKRLGVLIGAGKLKNEDRYSLAFDLSALLMRGEVTIEEYTQFLLEHYSDEREYLPLAGIAAVLSRLWRLTHKKRGLISDTGRRLFEPVYDRIGISAEPGEDYVNELLRPELLWPMVLFGSDKVIAELTARCAGFLAGEDVETGLLEVALFTGVLSGTLDFDDLRNIIEDTGRPDELKAYAYGAMGWFQDETVLSRVIEYTEEKIAEQNRIHIYRTLAGNPAAGKLLYRWLEKNISRLDSTHHYVRSIAVAEFVPVCEPEIEADLTALLEGCDFTDPSLNQVLSMARERRKVFSALKE